MGQFYQVLLPSGLQGLESSVQNVADICEPQEVQLTELRRSLKQARQVELALIIGGAVLGTSTILLDSWGYKQASQTLSIAGILMGATFAALRLSEQDAA